MNIYTIGHSTRSIDESISLLKVYGIKQLVDVRSVPGSRHNPQFGQKALEDSLKAVGIEYIYLKNSVAYGMVPKGRSILVGTINRFAHTPTICKLMNLRRESKN